MSCETKEMGKTIWLMVLVAMAFPGAMQAKRKSRAALLPLAEAQSVSRLCSREPRPEVEAGWLPTESDLAAMEKRFPEISKLQSRSEDSGISIRTPHSYYRRYVGVMVKGKKYLYVNAICDKKPPSFWQERLVNVCDGGCNWGVLYDIQTGSFSEFGMNGIA
jgi:hypothetical protein